MLGSGIEGKLRAPYPAIINYLNKLDAYKIAIDIPTGVNSDTGCSELSFKADLTVTLGNFKTGLFIALEFKGSSGKISDDQAECSRHILKAGGEYFIVRSIDDLQRIGL